MGTVSKALKLLDLFSHERTEIGLSELSRLSDMNKATCYRMLCELQRYGYVEQIGAAREYRLGPHVLRLALLRSAAVPLGMAAQTVLQRLALTTQETVGFSMMNGQTLKLLASANGGPVAEAALISGMEAMDLQVTATGRVVLAYAPADIVDAVLSGAAEMPGIRELIEGIRRNGFSSCEMKNAPGISEMAYPVFDGSADSCGAVTILVPTIRLTPAFTQMVHGKALECAEQITVLGGGRVPDAVHAIWRSTRARPVPKPKSPKGNSAGA
jgi:DNA-binding IclR family transcriptional regulator